jgi:hypothetical protein
MRLIGCDLHASQQSIAMLDRDTGEIVEKTLAHEGGAVREFYASIPRPVVVGIEATGSMGWFLRLMEELEIPCRVGHPAAVRKAQTRRQKHDRRDAALLLQLLVEDRFPAIWMPSTELRDLRALLLHRHQWVRMRTRVQNALHAIALAHGVRRGHTLWNREGQVLLASLPLPPHTADRRSELQALYQHLEAHIDRLDDLTGWDHRLRVPGRSLRRPIAMPQCSAPDQVVDPVNQGARRDGDYPSRSDTESRTAAARTLVELFEDRSRSRRTRVRGKLDLDAPIAGAPYTLRHLLQHTSGLPDYGPNPEYHRAVAAGESPWSVDELLRRVDALTLLFPPGARFSYSNIGYLFVRQIIERAADADLNGALKRSYSIQ